MWALSGLSKSVSPPELDWRYRSFSMKAFLRPSFQAPSAGSRGFGAFLLLESVPKLRTSGANTEIMVKEFMPQMHRAS